MSFADPAEVLRGVVLVAAPHMDDGVLGCGATVAMLPRKERVHFLYATDGSRSPAPILPWRGAASADIVRIREREAQEALGRLGVPASNVHFMGLPDGRLSRKGPELRRALTTRLLTIGPDHLLIPFRYDRHPDHLALHREALAALRDSGRRVSVAEYFVYHRWRLLPAGDVRAYVRPDLLLRIDGRMQAERKMEALRCFKSQTTRFYDWQERPILTPELLEQVCSADELFVRFDPELDGAAIFTGLRWWIRVVHRLEPFLKKRKDQVVALLGGGSLSDSGTA